MVRPFSRRAWFLASLPLLALLLLALLLTQWAYSGLRTAHLPVDLPSVFLPLDQFHEVERFPAEAGTEAGSYRWTRASSSAELPNPGGMAAVQITLAGGAGRTVPVTVQLDDARPLSFLAGPELRTYHLLQPMPASERVTLTIEAPTIEAANRTLGVVVSQLGISGGGSPPAHLLLALLLATAAGYLLLRDAGLGVPLAMAGIAAAQALVLLWLLAGGWQYALAGPLLLLISIASLGALVLPRWFGTAPPAPALRDRRSPVPAAPFAAGLGAWLRRHWLLWLVLLLALLVRLPWLGARDPVGDLELAARRMGFLYHEGLAGAYVYGGDYMPLRLYLLYGLSQFVLPLGGGFHEPLPAVTKILIKLPGLLADLATISMLYGWSQRWLARPRAAALAALYACAPPVWMNVAWWGQVDTLLMLPLVGTVLLLERADGRWSWLCWTVALLIKPQAIVFAPLLYIATVRMHGARGVAQGGAIVLGGFALAALPLTLAQQGPGLMQAYLGSVGRFPMLTSNAYNLWYLVTLGAGGHDTGQGIGGVSYRLIGLLLVASVALLVGVALLRRSDGPLRVEAAAVLALAFFALPTQIHQRYLFLCLAFLALRCASHERMVIPFVILVFSATLNILGSLDGFSPLATALIAPTPLPLALAVVNLAVLAWLLVHLLRSSQPSAHASAAPWHPPHDHPQKEQTV